MKPLFLTLTLCLVWLAWPAQAQDTLPAVGEMPTLSALELSLWPEFDRPEVLVIYRGLFALDTPVPVPVEIRIPAHVGQPSAVAYVSEDGQRFNQEHTIRQEGDWLVVSFELTTLAFQLEYYTTLPVDAEGRREFTYTYTADYPVAKLSLDVQEPPTAQSFVLDPAADQVYQQADGLTYHLVELGPLAQGETHSWTFTYLKPDSNLTVEAFVAPPTPTVAVPPPSSERNGSAAMIIILAVIALAVVGAGAFWLGRYMQVAAPAAPQQRPTRSKRRGSGSRKKAVRAASLRPSPPVQDEMLFCYQCGAQLRPDSEFCHKCGAAVRDR